MCCCACTIRTECSNVLVAMAKAKKCRGKKERKRKKEFDRLNQKHLQLHLSKEATPSTSTAPNSGMSSLFCSRSGSNPSTSVLYTIGIRCLEPGQANDEGTLLRPGSLVLTVPTVSLCSPAGLLEPSRTRSAWTICGRRGFGLILKVLKAGRVEIVQRQVLDVMGSQGKWMESIFVRC